MPNIKLYTSNRLEILADQLAELVGKPLSSPLKPETIVVQSKGMERWISMQLAERLGIWSNCRYYFPNQIVAEIFKRIIPEFSAERIFNTEIIAWQIMKILPACVSKQDFGSIKKYLNGTDGIFKSFQLSSKIADTFDQYLTYRPDMIIDWDSGKGKGWQADLWRLLRKELPLSLPPESKMKFFERVKNPKNINLDLLPERLAIFGISSMPVYHIEILSTLSDYIDIHLFFMNPSIEYWADIYTEKNIAKALGKYKNETTARKLHLEKGNSLLASMGELGRDFLSIILKNDIQDFPDFIDPGHNSLLCSIQSDILNMIDRGTRSGYERIESTRDVIKSDSSVKVHSCHSPVREIEVLYDNLLDMFNSDNELEPKDILVMMPDVDIYSPYISAIFNSHSDENHRIPFSIADRSVRKDNIAIDAFFAILDLKDSRFGAGQVLDILRCDSVCSKFDLSPGDLELIRRWIRDTSIKWGVDADYRKKQGLPAFYENTWKAGIERMLLGYAIPDREEMMYKGILPYDIEGTGSLILGKFIEYYNSLINISGLLNGSYTLSKWSQILKDINNIMFSRQDAENNQILTEAINKLKELENESDFREEIELRIIKTWLENYLIQKQILSGFITGGITFCAMLPMRSIPFKVICLIGMNDSAFPRTSVSVSFDLIAQNPKRGDRSKRNDDRYLFLEALISARKKLYISYVGQSIQDNTDIPPSVVVSELIDYIQEGYGVKEGNILDHIIIKHPLQSFSPRYYKNNENLFSYSEINCRASKAALSERRDTIQFINGRLSESYKGPENKVIELDKLLRFFINPSKYLLTTKLRMYLEEITEIIDEREPFEIKGLEKYQVEDFICDHYIAGQDTADLYKIIRARGLLPHGNMGKVVYDNLIPGIKNFSDRIKAVAGEKKLDPLEINLNLSGYTLTGRLENIWPKGMIQYRYADTKAKDRIKSWLLHLVLNASKEKSYPINNFLICKDASWAMEPIESIDILKELIDIFIKGNNELLYFFPETSLEYANTLLKKGSHEDALKHAEKKWEGNDYTGGEGSDPYYQLCFGKTNPLNTEFAEISMKIFNAMINHQKEIYTL